MKYSPGGGGKKKCHARRRTYDPGTFLRIQILRYYLRRTLFAPYDHLYGSRKTMGLSGNNLGYIKNQRVVPLEEVRENSTEMFNKWGVLYLTLSTFYLNRTSVNQFTNLIILGNFNWEIGNFDGFYVSRMEGNGIVDAIVVFRCILIITRGDVAKYALCT